MLAEALPGKAIKRTAYIIHHYLFSAALGAVYDYTNTAVCHVNSLSLTVIWVNGRSVQVILAIPLLLQHFTQLKFVCLLVYAITTVFQLYHGDDMMYEMRRRKPKPTSLPTQGIFNLAHHISMVGEKLAVDYAVSCTQRGNGLQHS